jgi:hypothetical protein
LNWEALYWGAGIGRESDAADLGGHRAFDGEAVGGHFGCVPLELDFIVNALGGEVFGGFGKIEGRRLRGSRAGASCCQGEQKGGGRER